MSPNAMAPDTLAELFDALDRAFSHIPYAICGRAAMHAWGFDGAPPRRVSVMCPTHSKEVIKSWAAANGAHLDPDRPELVGVETADGEVRKVRIKYLDTADFETLRIAQPRLPLRRSALVGRPGDYANFYEHAAAAARRDTKPYAEPRVLALESMLDQAALAYKEDRRAQKSASARRSIGQDALWIVRRLADLQAASTVERAGGGPLVVGKLSGAAVPQVLDPLFWDIFVLEHPEAPALFTRAGLLLPRSNPYRWAGPDAAQRRLRRADGSRAPKGRVPSSVWTIPEEALPAAPRTARLPGAGSSTPRPGGRGSLSGPPATTGSAPSRRTARAPESSRSTDKRSRRSATKSSGSGPLTNMNREL